MQHVWTEEGIKIFRELLENTEFKEIGRNVDRVERDDKKGNSEEIDDFEEMEEGKKGWWNKKRELRKVLRNDKKNLISLEEYRRRQYQKFCKEKK